MPFAVVKQNDVSKSSRGWAEMLDTGTPVVHRTKKGAEDAMRKLHPEGTDPWVYAGLLVEQVLPSNMHIEEE